jgi:RHS repeat-associated protein
MVVAEVAGLVAKWAARISRFLDGLIRSLANLFPLLGKLMDALARLRRIMRGLTSTGDPFVRVADDAAADGSRFADEAADGLADGSRGADDGVTPGGGIRDNAPDQTSTPADGRTTTGDPIDVATGEMVMSQTDVQLPGVLPLVLSRTHVSSYRVGRWFGPSWASTLDQRLEVDEQGVSYAAPDGMLLFYPTPIAGGDPVMPVAGPRLPLTATLHGYTIADPARGTTLHFSRPDAEVRAGVRMWPLTAISDRNANRIDLEYDEAGTLTGLRHGGGYHLGVETARGRITALRLHEAGQAGQVLVRYGYDESGRLTEVVNSSGEPLIFDYDPHGRIIAWQDRIGGWYRYDYNAEGRCVRTTGADSFLERRLAYDADSRTTTVTDSLGNTSRYVRNERGQVIRHVDQLGRETVQEWDPYGRLLARTDPLGRTTTSTYDGDGNLTQLTRPDGAVTTAAYNELRQPTSVTDPDGAVRFFDYDERGNLTTVTDPAGATTRYAYHRHGRLATLTNPVSNTYRVDTNPAGLPQSITDPTGAVTRYERDDLGRVVTIIDQIGGITRMGWTAEGQLAWRSTPDGATERWRHDSEGHLVEHTDAVGNSTRFEIGQFGLAVARTEPDGTRLSFDYDTELRLTTVTNPQGLQWRYTYDHAGQLIAETDFNGHTTAYAYDAAGQLFSRTNGAGETSRYLRDVAGNITERHTGDSVTTYGHDPIGRLVHARNPHAELAVEYDAAGRVVAETCNGATITSRYDAAGHRTHRRTPSGSESHWTYDTRGLPATLATAGHCVHFSHDAAGRETQRRLDAAVNLTQSWDANHRLLTQTLTLGQPATGPRPSNDALQPAGVTRLLQQRTWDYRLDGRLIGLDDSQSGARQFELDSAGRVTAVHGANWVERYAYDAGGNLTNATWPTAASHPIDADAQGEREYTATLIRRAGLIRYEHDSNGRVTLRQRKQLSDKPRTWRYTWDTDDHLTAVTTPDGTRWQYLYDPIGRRIAKQRLHSDGTVAERMDFHWDGVLLAEQTYRDAGRPAQQTTTAWDHQPGTFRPLTQTEHATLKDAPQELIDRQFYAIVTDFVDTPTELVAPDGLVAWRRQTTLWGTTTRSTGDANCPLRFPGQYYDSETSAHYNFHRYYDPTTARYQSPDPLGLSPAPNPYTYVPNPHYQVDPLGLDPSVTLPREVTDLAEAHITQSGDTVLGHFPGYIDKANTRGASYFDIGDMWNNLTPNQRWAANTHFLDQIAARGDRVLLSLPKGDIRPGSYLADEIRHLTEHRGYVWVNQWSLRPRG